MIVTINAIHSIPKIHKTSSKEQLQSTGVGANQSNSA